MTGVLPVISSLVGVLVGGLVTHFIQKRRLKAEAEQRQIERRHEAAIRQAATTAETIAAAHLWVRDTTLEISENIRASKDPGFQRGTDLPTHRRESESDFVAKLAAAQVSAIDGSVLDALDSLQDAYKQGIQEAAAANFLARSTPDSPDDKIYGEALAVGKQIRKNIEQHIEELEVVIRNKRLDDQ